MKKTDTLTLLIFVRNRILQSYSWPIVSGVKVVKAGRGNDRPWQECGAAVRRRRRSALPVPRRRGTAGIAVGPVRTPVVGSPGEPRAASSRCHDTPSDAKRSGVIAFDRFTTVRLKILC